MLRAEQIRAARALLGWRQNHLADASGVGVATIRRIEIAEESPTGNVSTLMKIQQALERAGIRFLNADESGDVGVRLAKGFERQARRRKRKLPPRRS
jgi:transcriptional regulator with XRE-family HTH domain